MGAYLVMVTILDRFPFTFRTSVNNCQHFKISLPFKGLYICFYRLRKNIRWLRHKNLFELLGKLDLYETDTLIVIRNIYRQNKRLHADRKQVQKVQKNRQWSKTRMSFLTGFNQAKSWGNPERTRSPTTVSRWLNVDKG